MYNCLQVLLLHTAAVTKDLGEDSSFFLGGGAIAPCPNLKPHMREKERESVASQ